MAMVKNIRFAFAVTILLAPGAVAQTSSRTFHLTTPSVALRAMGTLLRLAVEQVTVDEQNQTVSVSGSESDLALAAWFVEQFDTANAKPATLQYTVQGSPQDAGAGRFTNRSGGLQF